mmetsp:Transcript_12704/g.24099  ORF Transcript_12704/g.24099 Transcript_12704/m.24099 type:complete len:264 (+) Transcript_12704:1263-2054(+)
MTRLANTPRPRNFSLHCFTSKRLSITLTPRSRRARLGSAATAAAGGSAQALVAAFDLDLDFERGFLETSAAGGSSCTSTCSCSSTSSFPRISSLSFTHACDIRKTSTRAPASPPTSSGLWYDSSLKAGTCSDPFSSASHAPAQISSSWVQATSLSFHRSHHWSCGINTWSNRHTTALRSASSGMGLGRIFISRGMLCARNRSLSPSSYNTPYSISGILACSSSRRTLGTRNPEYHWLSSHFNSMSWPHMFLYVSFSSCHASAK